MVLLGIAPDRSPSNEPNRDPKDIHGLDPANGPRTDRRPERAPHSLPGGRAGQYVTERQQMSRINTNVSSLIAQRVLRKNNNSLNTSLARLSTGLKINGGADNPAGLIASEN